MIKKIAILLPVFFLIFLMAFCLPEEQLSQQAPQLEPRQNEKTNYEEYDSGHRFDQNGWIYVHIEGSPYERGKQHGFLIADELKEIKRSLEYLTYFNTGMEWEYFVEEAEKMYPSMMNEEMIEEIKGIAAGAQEAGTDITWQEILAWNANEEIIDYWWPTVQKEVYGTMPDSDDKDHCSAFIAIGDATKDGELVIAHNSFSQFETGQFNNLILDIEPDQGHRIFMQSVPGYIHSMTDFFETDAKLVGTETTIGGFDQYKEGEAPEFYRIRMAMQYSDNLDDFVSYMREHNNGGYANNWLVADLKTNEIMQFEQGLKFDNVQKKKDGYFVGYNAPKDPRIRNLECSNSGFADIRRHQGARQVRLTQLMEENYGKLDVGLGKEILADHYDVYLKKDNNPSSRTVDGHYELDGREYMSQPGRPLPYQPRGAVDGMVTDGNLAKDLKLVARWGNSSGLPFDAQKFLDEHIQWSYLEGYLNDRPTQPWTEFQAGEK